MSGLMTMDPTDTTHWKRDVLELNVLPGNAAMRLTHRSYFGVNRTTHFRANPLPPVQLLNRAPYRELFCERKSGKNHEVVVAVFERTINVFSMLMQPVRKIDGNHGSEYLQDILDVSNLAAFTQGSNGQPMAAFTVRVPTDLERKGHIVLRQSSGRSGQTSSGCSLHHYQPSNNRHRFGHYCSQRVGRYLRRRNL